MQAIPKFLKKRNESDSKMSNSIDTGVNMEKETLKYEAETKKILTRVQTLPQIQTSVKCPRSIASTHSTTTSIITKSKHKRSHCYKKKIMRKLQLFYKIKLKQQTTGGSIKLLESEETCRNQQKERY